MTTVLAAIDGSPVSRAVLETARSMARLLEADCQAIHVHVPDKLPAVRAAAQSERVALRILEGDTDLQLQRAFAAPDVVLGVLGVRDTDEGPRPAGHTTIAVLQQVHRPLIAVPPGSPAVVADLKRVLLPLDGTLTTTRAVEHTVTLLARSGAEFIVLHTFVAGTIPPFWDGAPQDQAAWEHEFLARYCTAVNCRLVLRTGAPGAHVVELARTEDADLMALGWHQDLSEAHAAVVREALTRSPVPILLLPAGPS
jgi:nucleotide-binding universal stress UspA family protein